MKIFIQTILLILAITGLQAEEPIGKVFSHDKNSGKVEIIITSKRASQAKRFFIQTGKIRTPCLLTGSYHSKSVCKFQGKDALAGGELVFANQEKPESETSKTVEPNVKTKSGAEPKEIKLGDGVKYTVLKTGAGRMLANGDRIRVHYTGWLATKDLAAGSKFDSSIERGQPFVYTFGDGKVIPGWESGCKNMKIGEKRRVFIPAHRGYGARGAGDKIPPNADLIFEIELLEIE